ncbi:diaminopimelate decarboxylase [Arcobacter sp. FWKO B]|uniref:diaminopimelate decarboxylase n=1 Tax=Arcobacter sp. FWKO B TaxID=2593672 RepID=UPI0018A59185|nr:diaminopimelate decarboxylase [Arcobacter sp. FWKO B]QOG11674.1 diaminopimelate decarboxylase [Arcobacter sp. FWKO B]
MNVNYKELAKKYGTPYYVYDFDSIKVNYHAIKDAFKARKSLVCYAVKANSNLSVIKTLANEGSGADCVSIGEVKRALKAGVPNYKIIFSGVGKSDEEIKQALELDILMINVESEAELFRVEIQAKELDKKARISIRVNPNIDPKTHPYISTGLHENKFGVDIDTAKRMYIKAKNSDFLDPVGIHFHIGSQLTELNPIKESSVIVADLVRTLKVIGVEIKFFDIGGGLGIQYKDETLIDPNEYVQAILETLFGLDVTVVCEPGRYIVGNTGEFVTKVLYEKNNGGKRFVVVDGAMNDLIRPSLYNAYHKIEVLNKMDKEKLNCNVVGPICESGDFFAKNIELPMTEHDDLMVIYSAGAYGFTMSSNYNTRNKVCELALENSSVRVIRKRDTFEDQIANEVEFLN